MKQKKKWGFRPTFYTALVLVIILAAGVYHWRQEGNILLNKQNAITLYREIQAGQQPQFRTEEFFPDANLDYEKVTYQTEGVDFEEPGVYLIPVFYDGQETNCVVRVTVKGEESGTVSEVGTGQSLESVK